MQAHLTRAALRARRLGCIAACNTPLRARETPFSPSPLEDPGPCQTRPIIRRLCLSVRKKWASIYSPFTPQSLVPGKILVMAGREGAPNILRVESWVLTVASRSVKVGVFHKVLGRVSSVGGNALWRKVVLLVGLCR